MLAPIEVSAPPAVKLCPRCNERPRIGHSHAYCRECNGQMSREAVAKHRRDVLSGAVLWQCRTCGCTDLAFFLAYSPDCRMCKNLRERERKHPGDVATARHLDPQAAALVSIPAEWEATQERINRLCNERLKLWLAGAWTPMSQGDRERCEDIAAALPGLWDCLRREVAASHYHERQRPRYEDGWSRRGDLKI